MSQEYLRQILVKIADLEHQEKPSLIVFDLDSTLFDVSPRVEKILLEFANFAEHQARFPQQCEILKNIRTLRSDWGFQNALARAGIDEPHSEFHKAVHIFWFERFFSNDYLKFDQPYEGAVNYVQQLHNYHHTKIVYLTGRDQARMGKGSPEILSAWNFPLQASKAELVLKPHKSMDDAQFKKDWFLQSDVQNFEKIWFFENEPVNVHLILKECPHVDVVFFESTHSGKALAPEDIPKINNFIIKSGS